MPKKFIKRYMPDPQKLREHKHLKVFGRLLHDPNLWHLNRRSVSGAFFVGLFMAFVPVPFQMLLAAGTAILVRVNLPISVGLVWLTNPITIPPMFYFCYKVGTWILHIPTRHFQFQLSGEWLLNELGTIWQPFLLGCFVVALLSGIVGALGIRLAWRMHIVRQIRHRRDMRQNRNL